MSIQQLNQTMSSVELVKIINELRSQENIGAELRHKDFMEKLRKVLGSEPAENFAGQYVAGNGQIQPCYYLPKREVLLMTMSESYKVQAAVYDRMAQLEEAQKQLLPQSHIEAVRAYLITLEKVEEQQSQIKHQLETISNQVKVIDTKQIVTNEGNDFFTINRIKELNPNMVFSGTKLTAKSNELDLPTTQLFAPYNMNVPNTYHSKVWNLVYPKAKLP